MAHAAAKLGSSMAGGSLKELRNRIFVVILGLMVYRFGSYVPVAGIDPKALAHLFSQGSGGLIGLFNLFSGGALSRATVFALGVMPYISSSIVVQMYSSMSPSMKELKKEGEAGRRKINQYTRYGTLLLSVVQGLALTRWLVSNQVVFSPSPAFYVSSVITLVAGTMFLMWVGEQMTEHGIGNGISLLIFASIASRIPSAMGGVFTQVRQGQMAAITLIFIVFAVLAVTAVVVYFERAQRKITINYAKRQQGRKLYAAQSSHLPFKINMAGVIPPIFAQSILAFVGVLASFASKFKGVSWFGDIAVYLGPTQPIYFLLTAFLVIFFSFFYVGLMYNPRETADNLKKSGAFIPGLRPGDQTARFIESVMDRLTFVGSIYLAVVSLLPQIFVLIWHVPFRFGGTSLLIIVVVLMDMIAQIQGHLMSRHYNTMMRKKGLWKH
jgi:preprotein translocase subunit SecY